jgi:uncharacterized protein HemX
MEQEKKSHGALIGSIIIIIILIIGGIYVWQSQIKTIQQKKAEEKILQDQTQAEIQAQAITEEDTNDLETLDQDLNNTNTNTGVDINTLN